MERVFTQDIRNAQGEIKFAAGALKDFPKPTWVQIASNLGMSLDEFTVSKEAASHAGVMAGKAAASTEKPERIVRRRANI